MFKHGETFRERHDGRIDVSMPTATTDKLATKDAVMGSQDVVKLLAEVLGGDAQLKSLHAVVALPRQDGSGDQHWHRDTPHLFPGWDGTKEVADGDNDESSWGQGGPLLPPYALNVFIPLVDVSSDMGPTEFTLRSHAWGAQAPGLPQAPHNEGMEDDVLMALASGSIVIADYRTVHRGRKNRSKKSRPIAMFIYGRSWWRDAVNYDEGDYGGTGMKGSETDPARKLFWSLVNKWQDGLAAELQEEWNARGMRHGL